LPDEVGRWPLATLRETPIKIGAKVARHGRYVTFQRAKPRASVPNRGPACQTAGQRAKTTGKSYLDSRFRRHKGPWGHE